MDRLHLPLRASEDRRNLEGPDVAAYDDPCRRARSWPHEDGRGVSRHDYAKLSWLQEWHIRDETYSQALAELLNAQYVHPFATHWGDGTSSSSDGQRFRAGGRAETTGHINPKDGTEPGRMFYTHISDQ